MNVRGNERGDHARRSRLEPPRRRQSNALRAIANRHAAPTPSMPRSAAATVSGSASVPTSRRSLRRSDRERFVQHEAAVAQDHRAVTHRVDLLHDVRRKDDRRVAREPTDQFAHVLRLRWIETVGRFVEHQKTRSMQDRLRDTDALPIAARQRMDRIERLGIRVRCFRPTRAPRSPAPTARRHATPPHTRDSRRPSSPDTAADFRTGIRAIAARPSVAPRRRHRRRALEPALGSR